MTDYVQLMMEEGEDLALGKDQAAPLITEVFSPMSPYGQSSNSL